MNFKLSKNTIDLITNMIPKENCQMINARNGFLNIVNAICQCNASIEEKMLTQSSVIETIKLKKFPKCLSTYNKRLILNEEKDTLLLKVIR